MRHALTVFASLMLAVAVVACDSDRTGGGNDDEDLDNSTDTPRNNTSDNNTLANSDPFEGNCTPGLEGYFCLDDSECGDGLVCARNACRETCSANEDCGQLPCFTGRCGGEGFEFGLCLNDTECRRLYCQDPSSTDCANRGTCVEISTPMCSGNLECGEGGDCPGLQCTDGTCATELETYFCCVEDADCGGEPSVCSLNQCTNWAPTQLLP